MCVNRSVKRLRTAGARLAGVLGLWALTAPQTAGAQGHQLERHEPTPAGESFFGVSTPWYDETRRAAAGLTFDYGRDVLAGGGFDAEGRFVRSVNLISSQLVGHLDVAFALGSRLQLSGTLPVTLAETGTARFGIAPVTRPAAGDPRLGVMVRVLGRSDVDRASLHLGASMWLPAGAQEEHAGDRRIRGQLRAVVSGMLAPRFLWSANAAYSLRETAALSSAAEPGTASDEALLSAGLAYVSASRRFNAGPELISSSATRGPRAWSREGTNLSLILGASYLVGGAFQLGPALGVGLVRSAGEPQVRPMLRLAWAPRDEPARDRPVTRNPRVNIQPVQLAAAPVQPAPLAAPVEPAEEPSPQVGSAAPEPIAEPVPAPDACAAPRLEGEPLATVHFALGSAVLDAQAEQTLQAMTAAASEARRIRVLGFTDAVGTEPANQALSAARAAAVKAYLVSRNVPAARVLARGLGVRRPGCAAGPSDQDRRVEVIP